jgi:hypothetical protein
MIRFLLFATVLLITIPLNAKKIDGYYIAKNGDTVRVTYKIGLSFFTNSPDFTRLQTRINYIDSKKNKHILRPDMAKEVVFVLKGKTIRLLSRKNNLNIAMSLFQDNSLLFLHLIQDGKVQLFKVYEKSGNAGSMGPNGTFVGGGTSTNETYILQKNGGDLFKTRLFSFKKDMAGFFSDCPLLADKIKDKTYRRSDVEDIVQEYNQKCQ